jgi:hypothetical protein
MQESRRALQQRARSGRIDVDSSAFAKFNNGLERV